MFHLASFIEGIVVGFIAAFALSAVVAVLLGISDLFLDSDVRGPEVVD